MDSTQEFRVKLHRALILTAFAALATVAFAQSSANRAAVVNGQTITQEELDKAAPNPPPRPATHRPPHHPPPPPTTPPPSTRPPPQPAAHQPTAAPAKKLNMSKEQL